MKKSLLFLTLSAFLLGNLPVFGQEIWHRIAGRPATDRTSTFTQHVAFSASNARLSAQLANAAKSKTIQYVSLPQADGSMRNFIVHATPLLPPALAAKYPELVTYSAVAADNPYVTAKLDFTTYGFHGMIYDGENTCLIDPAESPNEDIYTVHYKRDETRPDNTGMSCASLGITEPGTPHQGNNTSHTANRVTNGYELRKYRLALACSHQYAQTVTGSATPTKADVLSKMATTINRVNGIYEREVSVTMVFVDKEDTLIFTNATGDPYGPYNSSASQLLSINQTMCDSLIGDANYDLGHALSTGAGGLSEVGIVCKSSSKARCVTGSATPTGDAFDIDYVAHEMGHEYGADHTFNNNQSGGCAGNAVAGHAYEPGSGSTIMAYAGLCTSDNVVPHSDAYFHATSLEQIQHYLITSGDDCSIKSPTGNHQPGLATFSAEFTIPYKTPFELTAPVATDTIGDSMIYYCWEQWDLGAFGQKLVNTTLVGPLFRSFTPVLAPVRTFPSLKMLRSGTLSNAGIDNASGEKLPDVARTLEFRLAARSIHNGYGCFTLPDDSISVNVIDVGNANFIVTSQSSTGIVYKGYSNETVTWAVAGTAQPPINTANVEIFLSADSGATWPYHLGTFANTGAATVSFPNPDTDITAARIKVKGAGNIFFNINSKDFKLVRNFESAILLSPVPAKGNLHVATDNTGALTAAVFNMVGRKQWEGIIDGQADITVSNWARGVYIMKLIDNKNQRVIKKFVVE